MSQAISVDPPAQRHKTVHDRPPMLAIGIIIWLGSEVMFFSGLFAALFTIRAHSASWPPPGTHLDTVQAGIFTLILVSSSFTMWRAVTHEEYGNRRGTRIWIGITLALGAMFLGNQMYEWITQTTRPQTNAYGSIFFITTGLHGLHVFIGLIAMIFLLGRLKGKAGDPGELSVLQGVSYYWHFVDVVWIGLYSCLFLLK